MFDAIRISPFTGMSPVLQILSYGPITIETPFMIEDADVLSSCIEPVFTIRNHGTFFTEPTFNGIVLLLGN